MIRITLIRTTRTIKATMIHVPSTGMGAGVTSPMVSHPLSSAEEKPPSSTAVIEMDTLWPLGSAGTVQLYALTAYSGPATTPSSHPSQVKLM